MEKDNKRQTLRTYSPKHQDKKKRNWWLRFWDWLGALL